jgi:cobalt-zinc-cadmium resistance protein CzcA
MWTVALDPKFSDGNSGWQKNGSFRTPEGDLLKPTLNGAPICGPCRTGSSARRLKPFPAWPASVIGGYVKEYQVKPDPAKLISLGLSFGDVVRAIETSNISRGASTIDRNGEGIAVRTGGRLEKLADIADVTVITRGSAGSGLMSRTSLSAAKSAPAAPAAMGARW